MDKDVRLEILDWGGSGRPVVLLAGGGNTAHVFDDFAPKLINNFHVYGITRRGFGASGFSASEPSAERLGKDIVEVLDSLKLNRPVLVGHSIAGAELSYIATARPDRIGGMVYLEAGYPYAFDDGTGPAMKDFLDLKGPDFPPPSAADLMSFNALQKWDTQQQGIRRPEAEFRQTWESTAEGQPTKARNFPGSAAFMTILSHPKKYADMKVPALVIFALPHVRETWISRSPDPAVRKAADDYFTRLDVLVEKQAKAFEEGVPTARFVRLRGMHFVFLSNEQEVLREMRAFLGGLK